VFLRGTQRRLPGRRSRTDLSQLVVEIRVCLDEQPAAKAEEDSGVEEVRMWPKRQFGSSGCGQGSRIARTALPAALSTGVGILGAQ